MAKPSIHRSRYAQDHIWEKRSAIQQAVNGSPQDVIWNCYTELGELSDVRIDFLFSVELVAAVSAEVFKLMSAEDKKDCNERSSGNRAAWTKLVGVETRPPNWAKKPPES